MGRCYYPVPSVTDVVSLQVLFVTDVCHLMFVIDVIITLFIIFWQMLCHVVCHHLCCKRALNMPMADVIAICLLGWCYCLLVLIWLMLLPLVCY